MSSVEMKDLSGCYCCVSPLPAAGSRVVVPDGRIGTLDKWPAVSDGGLVKVNLDGGGCYVCLARDLRLEASYHGPVGNSSSLLPTLAAASPTLS